MSSVCCKINAYVYVTSSLPIAGKVQHHFILNLLGILNSDNMPKFSSIYPKLLHNKESIPVVFSDFIAPATITQASNPPGDVSAKTTIAFRQRGDGLTLPATTVSHLVPLALRQLCGFIQIVAIIAWHQK